MNRNEEYQALLRELEAVPPELAGTAERAAGRLKHARRRKRIWGIPAGSLAAVFMAFILLVNLFPPFAYACGRVPMLRGLAQAVAWSPSLSAAVENEYVQPVEERQTVNGVTAAVHYVIVDRKQINIFFSAEYDEEQYGELYADLVYHNIQSWSGTGGTMIQAPGELREASLNFVEEDVPDSLDLEIKLWEQRPFSAEEQAGPAPEADPEDGFFEEPEERPDYLAEFTFHLEFDPYFTAQGEILPIGETFLLDGQSFTLSEVELYPTHLRLNMEDAPENTAWLKGLELYVENERGEQFHKSINGITAVGDENGEGFAAFWLDSPFFRDSEQLTLYIERAEWRQKDGARIRLDLKNAAAENLPEGVRLDRVKHLADGWLVSMLVEAGPDGISHNSFTNGFWDEAGTHYDISQYSSSFADEDMETEEPGRTYTETFPLKGFHGDTAYLEPFYDRETVFDPAVAVPIK